MLHAPDCEEAPQGAPLLDRDHVLDLAENPATRLCTLCGCVQELTPSCVALTMAPTLTPAAAGRCASTSWTAAWRPRSTGCGCARRSTCALSTASTTTRSPPST
ncbi:DUF6233 domain-containing protein [Streptomyces sp. DH10]|nr:DUF6233 domain-containing protein [Streptomyces sp. DH10]MDG9709530.1 DUF6233 domain-containing protein [Streptomyces sp. DH10]